MADSPETLALSIEEAIILQGADSGDRLSSMRSIASAFDVNVSVARAAIELLVEREIVVKRWGSGVYLRKLPTSTPDFEPGRNRVSGGFQFFVKSSELGSRLRPEPQQTALRLGVWWHNPKPNPIDETFLAGAREQAEKMGHHLDVRLSRTESAIREEFAEYVRHELVEQAHDGQLILAKFADSYFNQLRDVRVPAVFPWLGSPEWFPAHVQPLLALDLRAAHRKALTILAAEGCRKIGLLGFRGGEPEFSPAFTQEHHLASDHALFLGRLGLPTDAPVELAFVDPADAAGPARRLLAARPDAIYAADDQLLVSAMDAFLEAGVIPGRDLPMIAHSSGTCPLPEGFEWSRMEFNLAQLGRLAVQSLVQNIQSSGMSLLSFTHQPQWIPGATHLSLRSDRTKPLSSISPPSITR